MFPGFAEASPEMTALKAALVARSYEVFLCDEAALPMRVGILALRS